MSTLQQPQIGTELREQIKKWILFRLGHPLVKVETTNENLDIAIDEAVRRFSERVGGSEKLAIFDAQEGTARYNLLDIIPEYIAVREVIYSPSKLPAVLLPFLGGITSDVTFSTNQVSYFHGTWSSMVDYTLWKIYTEQYYRVVGLEGQYDIIGNEIILAPKPLANVKVGLIYTSLLLDEDIRRDQWIKEWALSEVKWQLGEVRSKYGSIPGPRGDISLNGDALKSEAQEAQEKLLERLNEYETPVLFTTG